MAYQDPQTRALHSSSEAPPRAPSRCPLCFSAGVTLGLKPLCRELALMISLRKDCGSPWFSGPALVSKRVEPSSIGKPARENDYRFVHRELPQYCQRRNMVE